VAEGRLREDLMYRLCVIPLPVPPLRDREGDALLLAEMFLAEFNDEYGTDKVYTQQARERLAAFSWPGNVRELKNVVHRGYVLSDDEVDVDVPDSNHDTIMLPHALSTAAVPSMPSINSAIAARTSAPCSSGARDVMIRVGTSLEDAERALIMATLDSVAGSKAKAAQVLGISLKTLYNRLHAYRGNGFDAVQEMRGPAPRADVAMAA
jgi:DNA-binding NtrC family response regulator